MIKPETLLVLIVVSILVIFFAPVILNTRPPIHCTNKSDNTGGYYPVCTDPTFISVYTKYISKDY